MFLAFPLLPNAFSLLPKKKQMTPKNKYVPGNWEDFNFREHGHFVYAFLWLVFLCCAALTVLPGVRPPHARAVRAPEIEEA